MHNPHNKTYCIASSTNNSEAVQLEKATQQDKQQERNKETVRKKKETITITIN